jgi:uncharacterized protein (TIGR03086 family)
MNPQEQYLEAWRVFTGLADNVPASQWIASTPCAEWTVRALIGHVIDGGRQVQAMALGQTPLTPVMQPEEMAQVAGPNPAATTYATAMSLESALAGLPVDVVVRTPAGEMPLQQMLGMALIEPVAHGWDLASATGQRAPFDEGSVTTLLAGVHQLGGQLAASGMYQRATSVDQQAPQLERLMAALGREVR